MKTGIICALIGFFLFSFGDVIAKVAQADGIGPFQISFLYASVAIVVLLLVSARLGGVRETLRTRRRGWHALRALFSAPTQALFFFAIGFVPISTAYAAVFLAPFLTALLAIPFLKERPSSKSWWCIAAGFAGVLVALQPNVFGLSAPVLAVLLVAVLTAVRNMIVTKMGPQETRLSLGLFPCVAIALFTAWPAVRGWVMPSPVLGAWLVAGGVAFAGGLLLTSLSFRYAPAAIAAPFHYSQLVWGALAGALFFRQPPDAWTLIGCAIIVVSGFGLVRSRRLGLSASSASEPRVLRG